MIVDPDFLDHWKTRMLVNLLDGDETAPQYVLRLWAHCQNRRQCSFDMPPEALKALCRFSGPANKLESSLSTSGFIRRSGSLVEICNWDEYNSSLIAAWENGKRGGRPKKKPKTNPTTTNEEPKETQGLPSGNPPLTQAEPIREEKIGEDKKKAGNGDGGKIEFQTADGIYVPSEDTLNTWRFQYPKINIEMVLLSAKVKLMAERPRKYASVVGYLNTFLSNENAALEVDSARKLKDADRPELRKAKAYRSPANAS
jgi:hypothetical protein